MWANDIINAVEAYLCTGELTKSTETYLCACQLTKYK